MDINKNETITLSKDELFNVVQLAVNYLKNLTKEEDAQTGVAPKEIKIVDQNLGCKISIKEEPREIADEDSDLTKEEAEQLKGEESEDTTKKSRKSKNKLTDNEISSSSINNLMTVAQVSQYASYKASTIYSFVNQNKIPFVKRKGRLFFKRDEIEAWLNGES